MGQNRTETGTTTKIQTQRIEQTKNVNRFV